MGFCITLKASISNLAVSAFSACSFFSITFASSYNILTKMSNKTGKLSRNRRLTLACAACSLKPVANVILVSMEATELLFSISIAFCIASCACCCNVHSSGNLAASRRCWSSSRVRACSSDSKIDCARSASAIRIASAVSCVARAARVYYRTCKFFMSLTVGFTLTLASCSAALAPKSPRSSSPSLRDEAATASPIFHNRSVASSASD